MSLSDVLASKDSQLPSVPLSSKADRTWKEYISSSGGNDGWEMLIYSDKRMGIVNVPVASLSLYHQLVINLETGAWCVFTGIPAFCWCLYGNKPYFGTSSNQSCEFDFGTSDDGREIVAEVKQAFSYLGDRSKKKRVTFLKPLVQTDTTFSVQLAVDTDYKRSAQFGAVSVSASSGSSWDSAIWDSSSWGTDEASYEQWQSVRAIGKTFSIKAKGAYKGISVQLAAWELQYEPGGLL